MNRRSFLPSLLAVAVAPGLLLARAADRYRFVRLGSPVEADDPLGCYAVWWLDEETGLWHRSFDGFTTYQEAVNAAHFTWANLDPEKWATVALVNGGGLTTWYAVNPPNRVIGSTCFRGRQDGLMRPDFLR